jgi:uncharacterized RDD family membrane protein YckC
VAEDAGTLSEIPLYAGFWRRLAAALVDGAILALLFWLTIGLLSSVTTGHSVRLGVGFALALVYFIGFHLARRQATPGKLALGIKIAGPQGNRVSFDRVALRALASCVSAGALMQGFTMMALNGKRRALHDIVARTVVVRSSATPEEFAVNDDAIPAGGIVAGLQVATGIAMGLVLLLLLPVYLDRDKRAVVGGVVESVAPIKAEVERALREGRPPPIGAAKPVSNFAKRIFVSRQGEIFIRLVDEGFDGGVIKLTPSDEGSRGIKWTCSAEDELRKAYLPASCRD